LEYVRNRGYQKYLNSDNSLHQIWGAVALLAEKVDKAKSENRDLTTEEIKEVESAFLKAANSRRKAGDNYISQGDEIEELSKNIGTLAEIVRRLK
jgi:2,4-dienoyl-CoA reductase-like NADH-dependent reductase (Old Yellow Enzyme family)